MSWKRTRMNRRKMYILPTKYVNFNQKNNTMNFYAVYVDLDTMVFASYSEAEAKKFSLSTPSSRVAHVFVHEEDMDSMFAVPEFINKCKNSPFH